MEQHNDLQGNFIPPYGASIPSTGYLGYPGPYDPMTAQSNYTQAVEQYVQYPDMLVPQPAESEHLLQQAAQLGWNANTTRMTENKSKAIPMTKKQKKQLRAIQMPGKNARRVLQELTSHKPVSISSVPIQGSATRAAAVAGSATTPKEAVKVNSTNATKPKQVVMLGSTNTATPKEVVKVESTNAEMLKEGIVVDSTNAARLLIAQPDILSDCTPDLWHKVTVQYVVNKVDAINAINKRISPLKLIPYFFRMENGRITFLVNNCNAPLTTLFKRNLKVPFRGIEIQLVVQLRAKKVDLSAMLQKIISRRLSTDKTFLDLSNLTSIPEFREMMYDSSDTSHLQQQLMKMAGVMAPNLVSLCLAGNKLATLSHFTSVFANKKWKSLKVLDVMDNKLRSIAELMVFNFAPIEELYLHKNPVCGRYKEAHSYISVIRVNFPRLTKLDGTYLQQTPGIPHWRPNYISFSCHSDSAELADQFLEHFFILYDGEDRTKLRGLYHENAYFSLSSMYLPGQSTSVSARLTSYVAECRNLLRSSNKLKMRAALCHGAEKILAKLEKLPRTVHDPYTFTVDLLHNTKISTILTVTGAFKERNQKQKISLRHFMRTFILIRLASDEYQIVNDIMYVTNATTREEQDAFKYTEQPTDRKKFRTPRKVTEDEKNSLTETYSQLTEMAPEWSRKCLETTGWDLKEALQIFVKMYEVDKIPPEGFISRKEAAKS